MELFKQYNKNITFNVRIIKNAGKNSFSLTNIKSIYDNQFNSNSEHNIFFRPESYKFILIDLDNNPSEQILKEIKLKGAFMIIQTSKNHFQAWFYYNKVDSWETYTKIAKFLSKLYNADMNSTKSKQVGRLPGYFNRKPGRNNFKVKIVYWKPLALLKLSTTDLKKVSNVSSSSGGINQRVPPGKNNNKNDKNSKGTPFQNNQKSNNSNRRVPPGDEEPSEMNYDWAFLMYHLEQDPTLTKSELKQLLIGFSNRAGDMSYINKTVNNVYNHFNGLLFR